MSYCIPTLPLDVDLETKDILHALNSASRQLAELKGVAKTIPSEDILINTLSLQEAKDSCEVENIVTTQDDLYKEDLDIDGIVKNAAAKEVLRYREAVKKGFALVKKDGLLTNNTIKQVQATLTESSGEYRSVAGTALKNGSETVYTPPQNTEEIERLMSNLERFINDSTICTLDPLVKLAIIHHQFESIHPFYDGNGRTGRIIGILYLVATGLLDLPILYLSRYITHNKGQYYKALQDVRDETGDNSKQWERWVLFVLGGVEKTARETMLLVAGIKDLMASFKSKLRGVLGKRYTHELLNNLFNHPYTKIEYLQRDMQVSRQTATKYLEQIVDYSMLSKVRLGRSNYYINNALCDLFINHEKLYVGLT